MCLLGTGTGVSTQASLLWTTLPSSPPVVYRLRMSLTAREKPGLCLFFLKVKKILTFFYDFMSGFLSISWMLTLNSKHIKY